VPGSFSMTSKPFFRWVAWPLLVAVAVFTLAPIEFRPFPDGVNGMTTFDHLERFAAFALIGAAFSLGYPKHRLAILLFLIGVAGLLELIQNFVPDRHAHLADNLMKVLGAVSGTAFAMVIGGFSRVP
jgi:VanZ family protein